MATVYRLAREVEQWRALDRDKEGRYGVGFPRWEMGMPAPVHSRLREVALPFLLQAHQQTGETVQVPACGGLEAVYVERLTTDESVPKSNRVGGRLPLHATGVGEVLLAFQGLAYAEASEASLQTSLWQWTRWTPDRSRGTVPRAGPDPPAGLRHVVAGIPAGGMLGRGAGERRRGSGGRGGDCHVTLLEDLAAHAPQLSSAAKAIAARLERTTGDPFPTLVPESAEGSQVKSRP